ncbi:hypothetical protein RvY_09819 [Ramazzottius varieornatus]|uniref:Uncharacterized protein n=1 Tax=Ramazzottius varieornatus TaxID=947166 RepID=A0A1D1VG19_RAMVA|nr:hypothetical protein RvY_09819 [Ramazzottius varieornatus]
MLTKTRTPCVSIWKVSFSTVSVLEVSVCSLTSQTFTPKRELTNVRFPKPVRPKISMFNVKPCLTTRRYTWLGRSAMPTYAPGLPAALVFIFGSADDEQIFSSNSSSTGSTVRFLKETAGMTQ